MENPLGVVSLSAFKKSEIYIFIILFVLAFILRFFSFFPSIIDHDESTYLVIGNEITKGKILYTDVTDIKPVGIFYITAAFIKIFGRSIFGFRLFVTAVITITSFLLYKTKLHLGHTRNVALASSIIYIFFLSVWAFYGISVNTEHFFNFFTALALYILFSCRGNWRFLLAGFVIGLGFLIKVIVIFDLMAIFLFFLISDFIDKELTPRRFGLYFLSFVLFLVPFGIVNLAFYLSGHFQDFCQINYKAFGNYSQNKAVISFIIFILDFFLRFLPISIFCFWSFFKNYPLKHIIIREKLLIGIWFVFCIISAYIPGKLFAHYLIPLMLPMSLLAGNFFSKNITKPSIIKMILNKKMGYLLLGVIIIINILLQKKDLYDKKDCPRSVARYLTGTLNKGDILYTGNAQQILYFLLDISPPTRYIHSSLIFTQEHNKTLGINEEEELRIILNKKPRFILVRDSRSAYSLINALNNNYVLEKYFTDCHVRIFRLIDPKGQAQATGD